jgi:hypothetical protein
MIQSTLVIIAFILAFVYIIKRTAHWKKHDAGCDGCAIGGQAKKASSNESDAGSR